jgi:SAM-dependent methyltransferase
MDDPTRRELQRLSQVFYRVNAAGFDAKRSRPWRGWDRALAGLPPHTPLRVLDLGCGNGRLLGYLGHHREGRIEYLGVDECVPLLDAARSRYPNAYLHAAQLIGADGDPRVPQGSYDLVALMGVLHHIAGEQARHALVQAALARVAPRGLLVMTVWRFANDPRLAKRVVSWSSPEALASSQLDRAQLEPGDALLRWGDDLQALRYCHSASSQEIERWTSMAPGPVERFFEDGESGELNEYIVMHVPV